jgi:hypothetical protein
MTETTKNGFGKSILYSLTKYAIDFTRCVRNNREKIYSSHDDRNAYDYIIAMEVIEKTSAELLRPSVASINQLPYNLML